MTEKTYTIYELSQLLSISKANVCQLLTPRFKARFLTVYNDQIVVTQAGADAMRQAIDKGAILKHDGSEDKLAANALKRANSFEMFL